MSLVLRKRGIARTMLKMRSLGISALARHADVARNTAARFVHGKPVRPAIRRRLESAKAKLQAEPPAKGLLGLLTWQSWQGSK